MRKIFLALMAVAAIALTGCKEPGKQEPESPENKLINMSGFAPARTPQTATAAISADTENKDGTSSIK